MASFPNTSRLPWDVLSRVILLSDLPTQAVLSRVNYDFLVEASPLIYKNAIVYSTDSLQLLFSERPNEPSPRLNPHLCLNQILNLTIDLSSDLSEVPDPSKSGLPLDLPLSLSRRNPSFSSPNSPGPSLLPLRSFSIQITYPKTYHLPLLHAFLFPLLNPIRATFTILNRPSAANAPPFNAHLLPSNYPPLPWTALNHVSFSGAVPIARMSPETRSIAGLSLQTLRNLMEMRLDFESLRSTPAEGEAEQLAQVAMRVGEDVAVGEFVIMLDWLGEEGEGGVEGLREMREGGIVVVVKSEKSRMALEKAFERDLTSMRKEVIRVVVEEEEG